MKFKTRPCPVCESTDISNVMVESQFDESRIDGFSFSSRKDPEYTFYKMVICPVCNLLYAPEVPTVEFLETAYEEALYDSTEESEFAAKTYFRYLKETISSLNGRGYALDIGAGNGAFLKQLRRAGFEQVTGVEASRAPIEAADDDIKPHIRFGLFDPNDFQAESFNLISCMQTLEHLEDPKTFCDSAFSLLKPGGAFFVISHNYQSFLARVLKTKSPIFDIEHLQINSAVSMQYMLEKSGFKNIRIQNVINTYPLHYWLRLAPLGKGVKQKLHSALKKIGIDRVPLPMPVGNMAAIGLKP
ncbi:MAG: hypothetical protein COV66_10725 [Nitrospinae bacterium CG11_big_fil_rev_8_21_14_0_20_45_15]|nr:MAG: hypothetical protein COV66_10725 [Nitrospinae bacterium CG11_big_fil_rev_8_21_14_0_20_45_15]